MRTTLRRRVGQDERRAPNAGEEADRPDDFRRLNERNP